MIVSLTGKHFVFSSGQGNRDTISKAGEKGGRRGWLGVGFRIGIEIE